MRIKTIHSTARVLFFMMKRLTENGEIYWVNFRDNVLPGIILYVGSNFQSHRLKTCECEVL